MSIRGHKICTITVKYRQQYRQEDAAGNGYLTTEQGTTEKTYSGLFPNEEHARVWADARGKHLIDFQIIKIESVGPDVVMIEHAW